MWLAHPINPSNYRIVRRFDLLVQIAKIMRGCHFYYVSQENHAIYGVSEEAYAIRELLLPESIPVSTSFIFRLDTVNLDIVSKYVDFAIFDDMPWALIPLVYKDDISEYYPKFKPVSDLQLWTIMNKKTKEEVDFVDLYAPETKKEIPLTPVMDLINSFFFSRRCLSQEHYYFPNMHENQIVQDVFRSKASMGEKYLTLRAEDKFYGFFLFKNLFVLNLNDKLDIVIHDRIDYPQLFDVKFVVLHKNNPLRHLLDNFTENTYAAFVKT